jgi:hypothetical protein
MMANSMLNAAKACFSLAVLQAMMAMVAGSTTVPMGVLGTAMGDLVGDSLPEPGHKSKRLGGGSQGTVYAVTCADGRTVARKVCLWVSAGGSRCAGKCACAQEQHEVTAQSFITVCLQL